jgi:hypothetical protein
LRKLLLQVRHSEEGHSAVLTGTSPRLLQGESRLLRIRVTRLSPRRDDDEW